MNEFFDTLLFSWGSDTPPEVFWSLQELLKYAKFKGFITELEFRNPMEAKDTELVINNNELLINKLSEFFNNLTIK